MRPRRGRLVVWFGFLTLLTSARSVLATPVAGRAGMVATAHATASAAGVEMLRAGGNAIDAAVAAAFTLAVVEPYSSGIGGGGFALLTQAGTIHFLDFREVAPARATPTLFFRDGKPDPFLSRDGPLAVAVPGAVAGYLTLHERFGKLRRDQVLAPAVRAAEEGVVVDLAYQMHARSRLDVLNQDPEARRIFLVPAPAPDVGTGRVPELGRRIVQRDLARTLRAIAKDGARAFYHGSIAHALADDVTGRGGILQRSDLAAYQVRERVPLQGSYRGHALVTAPPPSSGGQILLTLLNVMETLPSATPPHAYARLHLYLEGSKRAFADRALLGDPGSTADLGATVTALVDKARGRRLAALIGDSVTPSIKVAAAEGTSFTGPTPVRVPDPGTHTTHLSVIDAAGNAVSLTTTVNYLWGAGFVAKGTGVVMNDEMDDFAIAVGVPNAYGIVGSRANLVAAGKVPLSSMAPTLVFNDMNPQGPVRLVLGSPGGSRIPTTVAQVIMHVLDNGLTVQQALAMGRVHHQHLPDVVEVEQWALDSSTEQALSQAGYTVEEEGVWSNAMAIAVDPTTGTRTAGADPRGVGVAMAE